MGWPVKRGAKLLRVERLAVLADRVDLEVVPARLVLDDVAPRAALAQPEDDRVAAPRREGRGRRETDGARAAAEQLPPRERAALRAARHLPPLRHAEGADGRLRELGAAARERHRQILRRRVAQLACDRGLQFPRLRRRG